MWNFASSCIAGSIRTKKDIPNQDHVPVDCSDDDASSVSSKGEGLDCPICWESFNIVENIPYVLWCGHTLCKNCILGLQWAVVKFPTLPIQLPLFIACPWCNLLSLRLVYRGNINFPRKNFFLLWMLESMNGDRVTSSAALHEDNQQTWQPNTKVPGISGSYSNLRREPGIRHRESTGLARGPYQSSSHLTVEWLHDSLQKFMDIFVHLTAKFPLVLIFLLIVMYAVPASLAILAFYVLVTVVFAVPSFLMLYFAYPSLDWLIREIMT